MKSRLMRMLPLVLLPLAACDLDVENPNALTEEEVLADQAGVIALAVGMQDLYAGEFDELIQAPALVTDELGTTTGSLLSYRALFTGPAADILDDYGVVEEPFENTYLVLRTASTILDRVDDVGFDAATEASISALARLYMGMALGSAVLHYGEAVLDLDAENPPLEPRAVVMDSVLALLEAARLDFPGAGASTIYMNRVVPSSFHTEDVINAMLARYNLFDGNYAEAITAADRVDLNRMSFFTYPSPDINPIFNLGIYVQPLASYVTDAEAGDGRLAYWVDVSATPTTGNPDSLLLPFGRYNDPDASIPVYLPDEMKLIKAEAYTRLMDYPEAADLINEVRTQTTSALDEPVAALPALPATALDSEAELLAQIAYERHYELYLQGLRWEDVRRLGSVITVVPIIDYLPIPRQECVTNESIDC